MIVPFPPAGSSDILARLIGPWLSDRLGQPFVIENRPGAATNIGTEVLVRAAAAVPTPPNGSRSCFVVIRVRPSTSRLFIRGH
jgi:tripartite-type tricarboxylate transporter receptor subunit TctC